MPINLLYDSRQSLNTQINELNSDVKEKDSSLKPKIDEYNKKLSELQVRIKALNEEIQAANARGGATREEYTALIERQRALQQESREVNQMADELSITQDTLNEEIDTLDQKVDSFNSALSVKSEGGKYVFDDAGERIDVSIYDNRAERIHILAHELGHSIGMDHVPSADSIMYEKTNQTIHPSNEDIAALTSACRSRNRISERLTLLGDYLHSLRLPFEISVSQ